MVSSVHHLKCSKCHNIKSASEFSKDSTKPHGYRSDCKECFNKRQRVKYQTNPEGEIARQYRYNYGVEMDMYQELYKKQGGLCAICQRPEKQVAYGKPRRLALDHCHETRKVRGLLCADCNRALGSLEENPERARALLRYIEERC